TAGIGLEEAAVKSVGGQLVFTDDITFSASQLINRHLPVFPKEVSEYLAGFSTRYSSAEVLRYLEGAEALKVLVIGETIIDEYVYCETLGKSGKEPVLATRHINIEKFAGGIVAVANHVSAFSGQVGMLTFLGRTDSQEDFISEKLNAKVDKIYLCLEGDAPTIVKRRYVEAYPFQKLFEVYVMDDGEAKPAESEALCDKLAEILPKYDVVIDEESSPTARTWKLAKLMELLQFGTPPELILEDIIELSDSPNSEKIIAEIRQRKLLMADTVNSQPGPQQG
ncbi:MAG: hypothetical protein IIC87_07460, partial [Chloroflexi bacterium]|nr:hypothetical protein [Chloroflexota bacterium]